MKGTGDRGRSACTTDTTARHSGICCRNVITHRVAHTSDRTRQKEGEREKLVSNAGRERERGSLVLLLQERIEVMSSGHALTPVHERRHETPHECLEGVLGRDPYQQHLYCE